MTLLAYLRGCGALVSALAALAFAAVGLRARLASAWDGFRARLAEAVLGLGLLVVVLEALGSVGLLRPVWTMVAVPVVGVAVGVAARAGTVGTHPPPSPRSPASIDRLTAAAVLVAFVVLAQWVAHAAGLAEGGLRDMDSLRYHGPFAARWVQEHGLLRLHHTSSELQETFFPGNAELLDSYGILLFGRDILTPFVNLGWFCLGCVAAVALSDRPAVRAATLAGFAAVCSTPLLASIEPGSAKNDIAAAALVLGTAALLCAATDAAGRRACASLVIVGFAAGLAAGTKLTALAPVSVLLVGAAVLSHRRARAAVMVAAGAVATSGFWYVRNLAATGNPLPWLTRVGPLRLPGPDMTAVRAAGFSVAHYATNGVFWRRVAPSGLAQSFGPLWVVFVAGSVAAVLLAVRRDADAPARVLGIASGAAALLYLVTPFSAGGSDGHPTLFALDLRFLAPGLVLIAAALAAAWRPGPVVGIAGVATVANQLAGHGRWPGSPVAVMRLTCGLALVAGLALLMARARPRLTVAAVGAVAAIVAVGWPVQADELSDRYMGVRSGLTAAFAAFAPTHDLRIAVGGFADDYPLYGRDLTNYVQFVGVDEPHGGFRRARTCAEWRRALQHGRYDYVVLSRSPVAHATHVPIEARWTAGDAGARLVLSRGVTRVFRLVQSPTPSTCPARS